MSAGLVSFLGAGLEETGLEETGFASLGSLGSVASSFESSSSSGFLRALLSFPARPDGFSSFSIFLTVLSDTWLNWIAPLFITLDFLLLAILIFATVKVWHIRGRFSIYDPPTHTHGAAHGEGVKPKKNPAILKYWTAIVQKANTGTPENLRRSVLEADALVDFFLKGAGYAGEHMADRLVQISKVGIKSVDRVWDAHRLRNDIAHTPGFVVTSQQAEKALLAVRDFLKEMQAF